MERQVTIYALCDPNTNEVRYIGQTKNPDTRLYFHVMESRSTPTHRKSRWINRLMELDCPPIFCTISVVNADRADEEEVRRIQQGRIAGLNLLNRRAMAIGGVAKQRRQTSKANVVQTAIDRMYQQEMQTVTTNKNLTENEWVARIGELRQMVSDLPDAPTTADEIDYYLNSPDFFGTTDFDDADRTVLRREMERQAELE